MASLLDRAFIFSQNIAPQHGLSRLAHRLSFSQSRWLKSGLIHAFTALYDIELGEAERERPGDYVSFNDFFTRRLKPEARDLDKDERTFICPVDGSISEFGMLEQDRLVQAKGLTYTLSELLAGDEIQAKSFHNGSFATIYLAPHNYHRVHTPYSGCITRVRHIPGCLYSVNQRTVRGVERLFAVNERVVVTLEDQALGEFVVILVGAMLVASIALECCSIPVITDRTRATKATVVEFNAAKSELQKGDELGYFNMGSTVILLAKPGSLSWRDDIRAGAEVRLGQALAHLI